MNAPCTLIHSPASMIFRTCRGKPGSPQQVRFETSLEALFLLLVVTLDKIGRDGRQIAKQAARTMIGTRRKVELGGGRTGGVDVGAAVSGTDCPDPIDSEGLPVHVLQHALEAPGRHVVCGDRSA